jgi:hypothetical protein
MEDFTGKKFNRLTVLGLHETRKVGQKRKINQYRWLCRCDCGNERIVPSCHLKSGHSQSCGCWREEQKRLADPQESQMNVAYAQHKYTASIRGLETNLTKQLWMSIVKQPCHYCGVIDSCEKKPDPRQNYGESFFCNGVDRIDNNQGYTLENSVPCCRKCNFMKWKLPASEFLDQCRKIVNYECNH